ncbi:glycoside hydrolase [Thozetella sp. PMI_491]|nr:glycoside hydrolase [Thozetella sp. PMI_491]
MRPPRLDGLRTAATLALCASTALASIIERDGELTLADLKGVDNPKHYYTELHRCPLACSDTSPSRWIVYNSYDRLDRCNQSMLFDFALYNPVADPNTPTKIRVCAADNANSTVDASSSSTDATAESSACDATKVVAESSVTLEFTSDGVTSEGKAIDSAVTVLNELQTYMTGPAACDDTFMLGYHQGTIAAIYAGAGFGKGTISSAVNRVVDQLKSSTDVPVTTAAQLCGDGRDSQHVFGVVVSTVNNITAVQDIVKGWKEAKCVTGFESTTELKNVSVFEDQTGRVGGSASNGTAFNLTRRASHSAAHSLHARAVEKPKPLADGTCFTYQVFKDENCYTIGLAHGLNLTEIETFNNGTSGTWGWYGCNKLFPDTNICLSKGKPPMPFPMANAVCGPTMPDSAAPSNGQQLKDLNPCPLNACCNVWGQCGISGDFCIDKRSESGNPGTSSLQNGCVASCGMDITNTGDAPASYGRVGYYETWNFNRPCLNQFAENANTDGSYTIMHWAFAIVNPDGWLPVVSDPFNQWQAFKKLSAKRVISFGGWGYSTEPGTYDILRQAMSPANRVTFAVNILNFLNQEGLDGVDFDWEYPGATDIDGTPGGFETDGPNYLKFLITLRALLKPTGKTISIAAPASYWYLRNFPISQMAEYLDYIVYMTYDLHVTKAGVHTNKIFVGESSYGRSFKMAQAGCTGPECTFLGDRLNSQAKKGRCTDTAGYISNAEIFELISGSNTDPDDPDADPAVANVKSWHDGASNSDMLSFTMDDYKDTESGNSDWPDDDDRLPPPLPACTGSYSSIQAIHDDAKIPINCIPVYIVAVLADTLKNSMAIYDNLMASGYDGRFATYADAVVKGGPKAVRDWMYAHGNDYFTCDVVEAAVCCDWCHYYYSGVENGQCQFCDNKFCNGWSTICEEPDVNCNEQGTGWMNITGPCPPDYSKRAGPPPTGGYGQSIYWHQRKDKEEEFYAKLYEDVGIKQEDIALQNNQFFVFCQPSEPDQCQYRGWDYGIPYPHGFEPKDVLNPKDIVQDAYGNLKDIVRDLPTAVSQLRAGTYDGDASDLAEALVLPVYMIEEAVNQIKDISDTVQEWDEEKRKNIILAFITGILFFVPVVGEVAGAIASLATIGRVISILGALGELATDIYGVVDTKGNDPLAIMSLVLAPLAIFDAVQIAKAAKISRGMNKDDIAKLGKNIGDKLDLAKDANRVCKLTKRNIFPDGALPMTSLNGEVMWSRDF